MRKIFLLFIIIFFTLTACGKQEAIVAPVSDVAGHILIMNDGAEYKGTLVEIGDDNVIFRTAEQTLTVSRSDVSKLNFVQSRLYSDVTDISQISDPTIQSIYRKSHHYKSKLADSKYVNILNQRLYTIVDERTVRCVLTNAVRILNDEGKSESTQYFTYLKNRQTARLVYAITIQPDGKVFAVDESAVNDEPLNNKYPLYDIEHRVKFGHKNADVGSLLIWQAEFVITTDEIFYPFYAELSFMDSEPTLAYETRISHPADISLDYEIYRGYFPNVKPKVKNGKTEFTLSVTNIPPCRIDEDQIPSYNILLPKVFVGTHIGGAAPAFAVSSAYSSRYFDNEPSDEMLALTDRILSAQVTSHPLTALESADALYYYINRSIQTAAAALSVTGWTPHDESVLCGSSYLSVLDKTYLFVRMLRSQKIGDAQMLLYCSADAVCPKNVTGIRTFNHVICEAEIDGVSHYYSFNGKNYSRDVRPIGSDGVPSLSVTYACQMQTLSPVSASDNSVESDMECTLREDGSVLVHQNISVSGIGMQSWRDLRHLSKAQMDSYINKRSMSFGRDVKVVGYEFESDFADYSRDIRFSETYDINDFAYKSGDNILFSTASLGLNMNAGSVSKPTRQYPYDTQDISAVTKHIRITLPDGYCVKSVPAELHKSYDGGSFDAVYTVDEANHVLNLTFESNSQSRYIAPQNYAKFKEWVENRVSFCNEWIVLERIIGEI